MRQSIHFVAVIRQLVVSACVAIEVVERFAVVALLGTLRPCYVGNAADRGTPSSDSPGDWWSERSSLKPRMSGPMASRRRDRHRCIG